MKLHFILFHISDQFILTKHFTYLQEWFYHNYMVLNPGKCYYVAFGSNTTKT